MPAITSTTVNHAFCLQSKATGVIARLQPGERDCGHTGFTLSKSESYPYFVAESEIALMRVLHESTPWYNATAESPSWGDFDGPDLMPVKVSVTVTAEPIEIPEPVVFETVEVRSIPLNVAKRYAGRDLSALTNKSTLAFWLVRTPDGMSFGDMKGLEGRAAFTCSNLLSTRKVLAVCEVPEDYVPDLKGHPGALLLALEAEYA